RLHHSFIFSAASPIHLYHLSLHDALPIYVIATMLGCWPVQHQASNFKTAELELCSGETFRATTVVPYYVVATEHGSWWVQPQPSGSKAVDAVDLKLCSGETFRARTVVPYYVVATEHGS